MSDDIDKCKKEIADLKNKIEEHRGEGAASALVDYASEKKSAPSPNLNMKVRRTLKGHFGKIYACQWAPDSRHCISASQDGKLLLWNAFTTNKLMAIPLRSSWVMTTAWSPSGKLVASGGLDNLCTLHKLPDNVMKNPAGAVLEKPTVHGELSQHEGYLSCARFVSDDDMVTSSGDSTIILWDVETKQPKKIFNDHTGDVMSVDVSPDKNMIVSGSCDSTVRAFDLRSGQQVFKFEGHESDINYVKWFPDGQACASASDDSTLRLWDVRSFSQLANYSNEKILCGITSCDFSKSGKILFAGYDDYSCYAWDTCGGSLAGQLAGHENRLSCLAMCSDGKALLTGSWDMRLFVWS